ncbi:MAG: hypothetical protein IJ661_09185 [Lachnospiraceae bacterium]|nr:hypothetical protein [Lachnospiraceae bacterium]
MARIQCKCGELLWNGQTPNESLLWVFSDRKMCNIYEQDSIDTLSLYNLIDYDIWKCPKCNRLYVFEHDNPSNTVKKIYKIEEMNYD